MIHFFRRIRQALLSDSKYSKYFLYAIGEIVLVMIGILLALQINTWNANRQKKILELDYLSDINDNLVNDTLNINKTLQWHEGKRDSILATLRTFEKASDGRAYIHELNSKIPFLLEHIPFERVRTAFDNMVSSENIGLISNKTIRTKLSRYYSDNLLQEGDQTRLQELTRSLADDFTEKVINKELIINMLDIELDIQSSSTVRVHKEAGILSKLFIMYNVSGSFVQRLENNKSVINEMIMEIDKELSPIKK